MVSDAASVEHERGLRDLQREFRMLFDQHHRQRVFADQALHRLQQDFHDDRLELRKLTLECFSTWAATAVELEADFCGE